MADTFIAAYDGSEAAGRAVDFAVKRAKATKARLLVVHVLEWSPYSFLTQEELAERHKRRNQELDRAAKAVLDPLKAKLKDSGVEIETSIKYGHVAETLCEMAKAEGAAQIFIGRTGSSSLMDRLFGSVAGSLAQIAPVPCTIVP